MSSLENIALGYTILADELPALNYFLVCFFALFWIKFIPITYRMQRGLFFLNASAVFFVATCAQSIWFISPQAIANDYLIVIVAADISIWCITAYAYVVLGKSRSNDAYGNSRHAYLGFIPIAGLWLLFTPSKSLQTNHITSNLSGAAAVIIGIFILIAGNFYQQYSGKMIDDYFIASTEDEALTNRIRDRMISYYISKNELEAALAYVRSFEDIGANYNESLILNDVVIQNNVMEYQFIYKEINNVELTKEMQDNLKEAICADYRQLISAGASIVWQFDNNIQQVLGRIIADRDLCAF